MISKLALFVLSKLDGWKTILGWLIAQSADLLLTRFPNMPYDDYVSLLSWLGITLMGVGGIDKIRKFTETFASK